MAREFTFGTHTIDFDALPTASQDYLIQYGINQSLTDSYASSRSDAKKEGKSDEEIAAVMAESVAARVAKLLDGTIGVRAPAGPKLSPEDAMYQKVASEAVKAMLKAKGAKPAGKANPNGYTAEQVSALVEKLADKFGEAWRKEAKRRLKSVEAATADVADDILSLLG